MQLCTNPSFEQKWTDLPPVGTLTNQQPAGFPLTIRPIGSPLLSTGYTPDDPPRFEVVALIPECVHKLRSQMPDADREHPRRRRLATRSSDPVPSASTLPTLAPSLSPALVNIARPCRSAQPRRRLPGSRCLAPLVELACLSLAHLQRGFSDRPGPPRPTACTATRTPASPSPCRLRVAPHPAPPLTSSPTPGHRSDTRSRSPSPSPSPPNASPWRMVRRLRLRRRLRSHHRSRRPSRLLHPGLRGRPRHRPVSRPPRHLAPRGPLLHRHPARHPCRSPLPHSPPTMPTSTPGSPCATSTHRQSPQPDPPLPPDPEPQPPPVTPPPLWRPANYVPRGTKLGFHGVGDGGQSDKIFAPLLPLGAAPPTAKVIVSLGAAGDILREADRADRRHARHRRPAH